MLPLERMPGRARALTPAGVIAACAMVGGLVLIALALVSS